MAVSLVGKIVITLVVLGAAAGITVGIVFLVRNGAEVEEEVTTATTEPPLPTEPTVDPEAANMPYEVGVGIADMTGPIVEITFMGYAETGQRGRGLHTRQFSRAFIFRQGDSRLVLVSAEVQSVGIAVRRQVVQNLQELYGDMYTLRNVILTGTHTHSTPGGYLVDFLLDVSILGFSSETYNAYVDGITRSIVRAHENMVPARLYYSTARVAGAHMNRSPYSYEYNPPEEKARYTTDTDETLQQVRIVKSSGDLHGVLSWFAVHTTSMNMTNHLVSSDNLGYAALEMERTLNPYSLDGKPEIVSGFFSSSLGDVSPNTAGARCEFSGEPCDHHFRLCAALERCFSLGPGEDMFRSTQIIGRAVYEGALAALSAPGEELTGDVKVVHQFVEMPEETVPRYDPVSRTFDTADPVSGCVPAMGYSFAAGTIDGANTLNITHGTIEGNDLLNNITAIVMLPTEEDVACHAPKPILLATGRGTFPLPWHPRVVSVSLVNVAGLLVAGVPGEPTTMAGRRLRDVIGAVMEAQGLEPRVAVSGLTNEYIHYVATYEEYQVQRYEAASTIYGPHTLDILLNKFRELAAAAVQSGDVEAGTEPEDNRNRTLSLILPVVADRAPLGRSFGDVSQQPPATVRRGDTVKATFVAANPRNDLKQESTHAEVQRQELGSWITVATDAAWETRFHWVRESTIGATSSATFEWEVPATAATSLPHRLVYYGVSRSITGNLREFTGVSNTFTITA